MEALKRETFYNLAKVLNSRGVTVMEIGEEYWAVDRFSPGDNNTPYHKLVGRNITSLLQNYNNIGLHSNNLPGVLQTIEGIELSEVQYSLDYSWKWLLR